MDVLGYSSHDWRKNTDDEYAEENGDVEITDHLREDEGEVSPMKDYKENVLQEQK